MFTRKRRRICGSDVIAVVLYFTGMLILAVIDQLTKVWAADSLSKIGSVPILGEFLKFTYTENTGAAFSMLQGKRIFLILFPAVLTLAALIIIVTQHFKSVLFNISLVLLSAGGIGNLIDRIFRGYVIDFIDFNAIHFAVFNVADICVTLGVALLIIDILMHEGNSGRRNYSSGIFTRRRF